MTYEKSASNAKDYSLVLGFCGLVTSLLTALFLWWIEREFQLAFYTWMFWFVIPIGAMLSGFAGASGYLLGAWLLGQRPTWMLLINILFASVATFLSIHYLAYITLEVGGKQVSDYIPFLQYLDIETTSSSMEYRVHGAKVGATGELGVLGYGVAFLQIIGFAVGGFAVYVYLLSKPYCQKCSRYLRRKEMEIRYTADPEGLQNSTAKIFELLQSGAISHALEQQKNFGNVKHEKTTYLRSASEVRHCTQCGQHWVKFSVEKQSGNNWSEIPELTISGFTDQVAR